MEEKARNIVGGKIIKLTEKYPNKPWNWNAISKNPNITIYLWSWYIMNIFILV